MRNFDIKVSGREYNIPLSYTFTYKIQKEATSARVELTLDEVKRLEGKFIVGIFTRKQTTAAKKKQSSDGNNLLSIAAMGTAHLTISNGNFPVIENHPLEHFAFDCEVGPVGSFVQNILSNVDFSNSTITLDASCLDEDEEDLELTVIYFDDVHCENISGLG